MLNVTTPWNLTCVSNVTSIVGAIPKCNVQNLPWWPSYLIVIFYIALYILYAQQPGKSKFVLITFLGMIASWLYLMFGLFVLHSNPSLPDYTIPTACTGLFIGTFYWVRSTT